MQEGSLLAKVEGGNLVQLRFRSNLDYLYEKMFSDALRQAQETPDDVEKGVQVIIFGWFWLEATCNMWLMYLLSTRLRAAGKKRWKSMKRTNITTKLKFLRAVSDESTQMEYDAIHENLDAVRQLRNRLVHFSDSFQEVGISDSVALDTPERIIEFFEDIPEPELVHEFRSPKIDKHADAIRRGVEWIESVVGLGGNVAA
jgi:hypothetical protein